MGLSLEFYAGDAAVIGADFTAIELDGLRDWGLVPEPTPTSPCTCPQPTSISCPR